MTLDSVLNNVAVRIGALTIGAVALVVSGSSATARAQQNGADIEVIKVRPNIYMIGGAGGNITAQVGPDGVVLVNAGTAEASGQVLAEIQKLTKEPIRYIINTSADADLVGGNAALSKAGESIWNMVVPGVQGRDDPAFIFAHENVLSAMRGPAGETSPFPSEGWPNETFFEERRRYMYLNDEGIEILHMPAAHSDGDVVVFFRRSDVVVAGHILDATRFPVIDVAKGGSIQGEIDALNRLIELAIPPGPHIGAPSDLHATAPQPGGTEVIPGRGRIYRQIDIVNYRDMVVIIRNWIEHMIDQKMTLEQIKAAAPAKGWATQFGATSGPWTTDNFVEAVYQSLMKEKQQPAAGGR